MVDELELHTVTLGLDFRLRGSHFGAAGQVTLKCTAEIETVFYQSADLYISSRTMASRSRFGSGAGTGYHGATALIEWGGRIFTDCRNVRGRCYSFFSGRKRN